jgi:hypothetical protein
VVRTQVTPTAADVACLRVAPPVLSIKTHLTHLVMYSSEDGDTANRPADEPTIRELISMRQVFERRAWYATLVAIASLTETRERNY